MVEKVFGRHDVWIDNACLHVGKRGLVIKVKEEKDTKGTLKVTDTHVIWVPKNKVKGYKLTWSAFIEKMGTK